jgi:hypothetical protein
MNPNSNSNSNSNSNGVTWLLYQPLSKIQKSHKNNTKLTSTQQKMLNYGEDIVIINKVSIEQKKYEKIIINKK